MKKQYIAPATETIDFVGGNLMMFKGSNESTDASEALSKRRDSGSNSIWSDNKDGQSAWGGSAWGE